MDLMTIGEFARRSRLSAKALRRYDELALLPPARVDGSSGYRFYDAGQLQQARLVAALRQLQVPLADIKFILGLTPQAAAERVTEHWAAAEAEHAIRRELAGYLVDRLTGKRSVMYEVAVRDIPTRSLLCLGEVSDDSDGPIEWCRPVPDDQAHDLAGEIPELSLRTEDAHQEAFVSLGPGGEISPAQWQLASESLFSWAGERGKHASELGARVTLLASAPITAGSAPDCDFAVPLA